MATLEELEARKETLETAMASGDLRVKYGDREVTFRSFDEMERQLAFLNRKIRQASGKKLNRKVRVGYRSGWQ